MAAMLVKVLLPDLVTTLLSSYKHKDKEGKGLRVIIDLVKEDIRDHVLYDKYNGKYYYKDVYDPSLVVIHPVFRKSEDVPPVVDDALNRKDHIKVIWMQEGIYNEEAEKKAKENGMDVVYNRCMMAEHRRLF
jgi:hypothetical protein